MKFIYTFATVALVSIATAAYALDLQSARTQGLVGEKADGYVTALKSTPEVQQLVGEVNARRKTEYQKISAENKQPVDVVAKLATAQILQNLPSGAKYQGSDGSWKTK